MAVAISQTANPAGAGTGTTITYSGVAIGTADAGRIVAVCVGAELTGGSPSSASINGVTMTAGTLGTLGGLVVFSRIFWLPAPTGTTADIAITFGASQGATTHHIAVYKITGAGFSAESAVGDTDADPISSGAITIPASGGCLAIASFAADTTARTWTGIAEDIDADAGTFRFTTGMSITGGTPTITVSGANNEDGTLAWLIFKPGVVAQAGAYSMTGTAAGTKKGYKVTPDAGVYALTGTDAVTHKGYRMIPDAGSYAMTGVDAGLLHKWKVPADPSSYDMTGVDATLTKAGGGPSIAVKTGMFSVM